MQNLVTNLVTHLVPNLVLNLVPNLARLLTCQCRRAEAVAPVSVTKARGVSDSLSSANSTGGVAALPHTLACEVQVALSGDVGLESLETTCAQKKNALYEFTVSLIVHLIELINRIIKWNMPTPKVEWPKRSMYCLSWCL